MPVPPLPSIETILSDAVEIADPAARSAYLDRACNGDGGLRTRVDRLIDNHIKAGNFLEPSPIPPTPGPAAGDHIGPYLLREQIGEGGMGLVFVADQEEPVRRRVALKVVKPGMDTRQVLARFAAERQALALMDHPNIARVLDAGATDAGRPYFVMELVRGVPITDYCDQARLPLRERLELFLLVCRAVQHAHQKGIIHRDLKPSNILVTTYDGHAVPKVIDFGIAKAIGPAGADPTVYTGFAQLIGTPAYMSPEQAEMTAQDVDTRADVYALGVVLYEVLTGTTPFDSETLKRAGFDEMRRIIREDEPVRPSHRLSTLGAEARSTVSESRKVGTRPLSRLLRGELDWIVMRCLEKDRDRRYESASALAADVERYLADDPVAACPPSAVYRVRKFVQRYKGRVSAAAAVVLTVSAVPTVATWYSFRLEEEALARRGAERDASRDRELAVTRDFLAKLERVHVRRLEQQSGWADRNLTDLKSLAELTPAAKHLADLRSEAVAALTAVDLKPVRTLAEGFSAYYPAYSPDGSTLALAGWEELPAGPNDVRRGVVQLYDPSDGRLKKELTFPLQLKWTWLQRKPDGCRTVAFSPDGRWLVAGSRGGQLARWDLTDPESKPIVWAGHVNDHGKDPSKLDSVFVRTIAFSVDGRRMYTSSLAGGSQAWAAGTDWKPIGPREPYLIPIGTSVLSGKQIGTIMGPKNETVRIDRDAGKTERFALNLSSRFTTSQDGGLTAGCADDSQTLCLLTDELTCPPVPLRALGQTGVFVANHLGFAPGNGILATSEEQDKRVRLWDVADGTLLVERPLSGGSGRFAFSPDGRSLAVTELNRTVVYEITGRARETVAVSNRRYVRTFAVASDGNELVLVSQGDPPFVALSLWDTQPGRVSSMRNSRQHIHFLPKTPLADFHPTKNGYAFVTTRANGNDPARSGGDMVEYRQSSGFFDDLITDLRFDPVGRLWSVEPNCVRAWPVWTSARKRKAAFELRNDADAQSAGMVYRAIAPGKSVAVIGRRDGRVFVIDELQPPKGSIRVFDSGVTACALALSEDRALIGGERGELVEMSIADGSVRSIADAHADDVLTIAYGPGGWFATGSADRTIKLWAKSGRHLLTIRTGSGVRKLAVSSDGQLLTVLLDNERAVRRWRLDQLIPILDDLGIPLVLNSDTQH